MARVGSWPSAETALEIHQRLCQDDPVAPSDLAVHYLDPLAEWVARTNPRIDPHLCDQAAEDAILALIRNPRAFDPAKGALDAYLRMSAQGDLRNALERERRHSQRRERLEVVELFGGDGNLGQDESDPALIVERDEADRETRMQTISLGEDATFTPEELGVYELMRQGERRTAAFAAVLGIGHLDELEQRREVKRVKDRIKRRLQRARGRT